MNFNSKGKKVLPGSPVQKAVGVVKDEGGEGVLGEAGVQDEVCLSLHIHDHRRCVGRLPRGQVNAKPACHIPVLQGVQRHEGKCLVCPAPKSCKGFPMLV